MKAIVVGDSCAGKTLALQALEKEGFAVVFEDGWQRIPKETEADKLQSNLWFTRDFFRRESPLHGKDIILEHCFHFQYPFTHAQFQAGKISIEQRDEALLLLDTLCAALPLEPDTVLIHLTCASDIIARRLEERGRPQPAGQAAYRDLLRALTERYFRPRCRYHQLDTTEMTPEQAVQAILGILSQEGVSETLRRRGGSSQTG
jgi:broad-specificity NMP kinase